MKVEPQNLSDDYKIVVYIRMTIIDGFQLFCYVCTGDNTRVVRYFIVVYGPQNIVSSRYIKYGYNCYLMYKGAFILGSGETMSTLSADV